MMQDHVVGLGSLAQTRARTPRVFRWGMRRNKHVLLSVRVSAHAKGHAPPKHSGVLAFLAPDRTPRVSSGPEWAARESTQPARGTPCATGLACQRGTRASGGRVVRATPRRSESLPPGALGDVLMGWQHAEPRCLVSIASGYGRILKTLRTTPPLQSIFGRGVKRSLHPCSFYGKGKKMIALPAYIDPEAWVGFVEMRRAMPKTKPFTDRAAKLILYELQRIKDAGHDPNAALDQSTLRGWADVWPAKAKDIEKANGTAADATRDYLEAEKARPVVAPPENIRALVRGIGRAA